MKHEKLKQTLRLLSFLHYYKYLIEISYDQYAQAVFICGIVITVSALSWHNVVVCTQNFQYVPKRRAFAPVGGAVVI